MSWVTKLMIRDKIKRRFGIVVVFEPGFGCKFTSYIYNLALPLWNIDIQEINCKYMNKCPSL